MRARTLLDPGFLAVATGNPSSSVQNVWSMDEASGNRVDHINGVILGPVDNLYGHTTSQVAGKLNYAINFDGGSWLKNDTSFDLPAGDFTVALWVKLTAKAGDMGLLCKSGTNPDSTPRGRGEFSLIYHAAYDRLEFTIYGTYYTMMVPATSFGSPPINTWFQVFIYVRGSTMGIAVNNSSPNELAMLGARLVGTDPFRVGCYFDAFNLATIYYLNGAIDELDVWSKALSGADRIYVWNGGVGRSQ